MEDRERRWPGAVLDCFVASIRLDHAILQPLMIAFGVVIGQELAHGPSQGRLAEEDEAIKAFLSEGSVEAFQVSVEVEALRRRQHCLDALCLQDCPERRTELAVPIQEHVTLAAEEAVLGVGQVPGNLRHPRCVGIGRATGEADPTHDDLHDEQQIEGEGKGSYSDVVDVVTYEYYLSGSTHVPGNAAKALAMIALAQKIAPPTIGASMPC